MAKNGNKSLGEAKKHKKDEFYTQLGDINAELGHYSANYDAIDVAESNAIPEDWDGMMGVPITFLDKYNPDQFEIIGIAEGDSGKELGLKPVPRELKKVNPSLRDGQLYLMKGGKPVKPFSRIIIRRWK